MKKNSTLILNVITLFAFILYAIGIFLETVLLNKRWGNSAVDYSLRLFGPVIGVMIVVVVGGIILLFAFLLSKLDYISIAPNVFLCWFWILSLYQCAINSFLTFYGLPNEPINLFFKTVWPNFWYPMKEITFTLISIVLTYFWMKNLVESEFQKLDILIIIFLSVILLYSVIMSQLYLINTESNVYS